MAIYGKTNEETLETFSEWMNLFSVKALQHSLKCSIFIRVHMQLQYSSQQIYYLLYWPKYLKHKQYTKLHIEYKSDQ